MKTIQDPRNTPVAQEFIAARQRRRSATRVYDDRPALAPEVREARWRAVEAAERRIRAEREAQQRSGST